MTPEIKEMIELAAKAMGYGGEYCEVRECFVYSTIGGNYNRTFHPLTPADSHALMCELEIDIYWIPEINRVEAVKIADGYKVKHRWQEPYTTDKSAACRLAVLRVAAEIGRRK